MATRGKSKTELAYFAGLFDGEGYITILRVSGRVGRVSPSHVLVAGMSNTHRPSIESLKAGWRGTTMLHNQVFPNRKRIYMWRVAGPVAVAFIEDLLPYLRVKTPQAVLALKFQELKSHRWGRAGIPMDNMKQRNDLCEQIRALNASRFPRPQRLSEGAPLETTDEAIVQA